LLRRVERLEDVTSEVKERLARYETRDDLNALQMATKADLGHIAAQMATAADLAQIAAQMASKADLDKMASKADLDKMASKADLVAFRAEVKGELAALEARLLRWFIATAIALAGVVSAATKLLA
jgi:hypothetical protein